jgi:hypothetical protein
MKTLLNIIIATCMIALVIIQSGCRKDGGNTEYPDVTANPDTINGRLKYWRTDTTVNQIVNWPYGTAVIKAIVANSDEIAVGTVNADGTFSLILPATVSGFSFNSLAEVATLQGGTIKATPETVRFQGSTSFKVEYTQSGKAKSFEVGLHTFKTDLSVEKTYYYNFYDSDGTFKGTGSGTYANTFNWTFTKGWGCVETSLKSNASTAINSITVSNPVQNAVWVNY